jgi:hypothetical protein
VINVTIRVESTNHELGSSAQVVSLKNNSSG